MTGFHWLDSAIGDVIKSGDLQLPKMMQLLFACNDPENGTFIGKADWFEFDDCETLSVTRYGQPLTVRVIGGGMDARIRIARRVFPCMGYTRWVGNWCWDAVWVDVAVADEIANYLRSFHFQVDCAVSTIAEMWRNDEPIDFTSALSSGRRDGA